MCTRQGTKILSQEYLDTSDHDFRNTPDLDCMVAKSPSNLTIHPMKFLPIAAFRLLKSITNLDNLPPPLLASLPNGHPRSSQDVPSATMSARQMFNNIARRRLVPPKPQKSYVKWYMSWADTAHKAVVLTCVGVTGRSLSLSFRMQWPLFSGGG